MTRVMREFCQPEIRFDGVADGLLRLTALRPMTEDLTHVRVTHASFPATFVIPLSETITITQMHVPVDDTHTYWYSFFTSFGEPLDRETMRAQRLACVTLPDYAPKHGRHNHWGFDAEEQRSRTYLGMGEDDINLHDQWAVESMGEIQDRTREHLGTSDKVIMANRRTLLKAIETVRSGGRPPMALAAADAAALRRPRHHRLHRAGASAGRATGPRRPRPSGRRAAGCSAAGARPAERRCARRGRGPPVTGAQRAPTPTRGACRRLRRRRAAHRGRGVEHVRIGWCDLHGVLRGKTLVASAVAERLRERRRHGQHHPAQGHLRQDGVPRLRARRDGDRCPASASPTTCSSCPTRRAFASCRGRRRPAGCAPRRASRTARRCRSTPAASCSRRWRGWRAPATACSAGSRSSSTSTGSPRPTTTARSTRRAPPGRASRPSVHDDPPGLQPARRRLGRHGRRAAGDRPATAQELGLPLRSLEIELGPSQVEAVFDPTDALDRGRPDGPLPQRRAPGAAPRRLPRELRLPAAVRRT